ncbi:putative O-glycosylation ligase, exosortase A system-associated [soil metagenome]
MRDLIVVGAVLAALPFACRHTWVGILLWTWLSVMNPHRLAYGFAQDAPLAAMAAAATVLSLFITKDKLRMPWGAPVILMILLLIWMSITTVFAIHTDESIEDLKRITKIFAMTLVAFAAIRERKHIELFIWVNVLSIGFFGLKGGLFTIASGGSQRVWGPPGAFIEGNNEVGLALVMTIPLINYLRLVSTRAWMRTSLLVLMLLCAVAVLGTQSRGAFLAISAMGLVMWFRSEKKLFAAVSILTIGIALTQFMPDSWGERMDTIGSYQEDGSAMGRINAWWNAFNLANDRFLGGGFQIYSPDIFAKYAPVPDDVHAAHSIYFQMLGEHGWIGLGIFLLIGWHGFSIAGKIRKEAIRQPEAMWAYQMAGMVQVSMIGFAVGGAFLSLAYFDLPYNILVVLVAGLHWVREQRWKTESEGAFGSAAPVAKLNATPAGKLPS